MVIDPETCGPEYPVRKMLEGLEWGIKPYAFLRLFCEKYRRGDSAFFRLCAEKYRASLN